MTGVIAWMHKEAQSGAASGAFDDAGHHRLAKQWDLWDVIAIVTPLLGLALMVLKPVL